MTDILFALLALAAVAVFSVLISLQVSEDKFYKDPMAPFGGNVWPASAASRQ